MDLQAGKPTGKPLVKSQLLVTNTFMLGGRDNETEEKDSLCHYNAQGSRISNHN